MGLNAFHVKPERVVAIHQPNYAPWCGYFAKMMHCDVFIFLDDAQMPGGQSFVYRTKIGSEAGPRWLSVPTRYHLGDAISKVHFADYKWSQKHLNTLKGNYAKAPFFKEVWSIIAPLYEVEASSLSDFNQSMIVALAGYLNIPCKILRSSDLTHAGVSDDRLITSVLAVGGTCYLSGKGGQNYQDPAKFSAAGIDLDVRAYLPRAYRQIHGEPILGLSILDAVFNLGKEAADLLKYDSPTLEPHTERTANSDFQRSAQ